MSSVELSQLTGLTPIDRRYKEGAWRGERAFIIGGGPSLKGFPFERLAGERVIACNRAHECGVAEMIVTADRWWLSNGIKREVSSNLPIIYTCHVDSYKKRRFAIGKSIRSRTFSLHCCNHGEWGMSFEEGVTPGDTGIRAANLASILGADPIYLLGMDMGAGQEGEAQEWWHGGYERRDQGWYADFLENWECVAANKPIAPQIYNMSPVSNLQCFPFVDWKEVI